MSTRITKPIALTACTLALTAGGLAASALAAPDDTTPRSRGFVATGRVDASGDSSSSAQASTLSPRSINISMNNGHVVVAIDGKTWPDDLVERNGDQVTILDESGNVYRTFQFQTPGLIPSSEFPMRFAPPAPPTPPPVMVGLSMGDVNTVLRAQLGLSKDEPAFVVAFVVDGLPADKAGLELYDVVVGMSSADLTRKLRDMQPGDTLQLDFIRHGQRQSTTIEVAAYDMSKLGMQAPDSNALLQRFPTAPNPLSAFDIDSNGEVTEGEIGRSLRNDTLEHIMDMLKGLGADIQSSEVSSEIESHLKAMEESLRDSVRSRELGTPNKMTEGEIGRHLRGIARERIEKDLAEHDIELDTQSEDKLADTIKQFEERLREEVRKHAASNSFVDNLGRRFEFNIDRTDANTDELRAQIDARMDKLERDMEARFNELMARQERQHARLMQQLESTIDRLEARDARRRDN